MLLFIGMVPLDNVPSNLDIYRILSGFWPFGDTVLALLLSLGCIVLGSFFSSPKTINNKQNRLFNLIFLLILLVGAALRFYGISFGLPNHFHPDEIRKAQIVSRMLQTYNFNPEYFLHPSLLLYLAALLDLLFVSFGAFQDTFEGAFLSGRIVSGLAGVGTIYVAFLIGRDFYTQRIGVLAAAFVSVFPLTVTCSRYFKEDSLFTFLLLLALYRILIALKKGSERGTKIAAFCVGMCISSKYTGIALIGIYLVAPLFSDGSRRKQLWINFLWSLPFIIFGFVLCTPYSILAPSQFIQGVLYEGEHILRGHTESISAWSQFGMYHFGRNLLPGMTLLPACGAFFAIGFIIRERDRNSLFLLTGALLFYLLAEISYSKPPPQSERYILPCVPILALLLSSWVEKVLYARTKWGAGIVVFLLFFIPLFRTHALALEVMDDTRLIAAEWIESNIPKGSRVVLDFLPYSPPLDQSRFQIINNPLLPIVPYLETEMLKTHKVQYLVLSSLSFDRFFSQPTSNVALRTLYRRLFSRYDGVLFRSSEGTYGFHNPTIALLKVQR